MSQTSYLHAIAHVDYTKRVICSTHIIFLLARTGTKQIFNELLILMNLNQHAKNQVSSICSGDAVDLKILQSD